MRLLQVGFILALVLAHGCGGAAPEETPTSKPINGRTLPVVTGNNVMSMTVNGTNCSSGSYLNKPCVAVTICAPGSTTNCTTVDDILLDTGSYGLRVFKSALGTTLEAALTAVEISGQVVGECARFGDGSNDWGPVKTADVVLGNESPVSVPIHVIDSTFATTPVSCASPDVSPSDAGFNGILGVGVFKEDCGNFCVSSNAGNNYFRCTSTGGGATCTSSTIVLANQVQNPVALLVTNNNGVIVQLPSIPTDGVSFANGYVIFGIGTQSNNSVSGVTKYATDSEGHFTTVLNGQTYNDSFLDTGSNGLFFPASALSLPDCATTHVGLAGWYCPTSLQSFTALNSGAVSVPFQIGNFYNLAVSSYSVFLESGADIGGTTAFDWGLPFYLGRNVYVGIENTSSSLGTGPYVAY